jgi:hypothetical protein
MKDFASHLRAIHFSIVAVSVGLLMIGLFDSASRTQKAHSQLRSIIEYLSGWENDFLQSYAMHVVSNEKNFENLDTSKVIKIRSEDKRILHLRVSDSDPQWSLFNTKPFTGQQGEDRLIALWESELEVAKPKSLRSFVNIWDELNQPVYIYVPTKVMDAAMLMSGPNRFNYLLFKGWEPIEYIQPEASDEVVLNYSNKIALWALHGEDLDEARDRFGDETISHVLAFRDDVGIVPGFNEDSMFDEKVFAVFIPVTTFKIEMSGQAALLDHLAADWPRGSFEYSFPELSSTIGKAQDVEFDDLELILRNLSAVDSDNFKAFGFEIPADMIAMIGLPLLASIQLYFLLHLRVFNREFTSVEEPFPWIGLYQQRLPHLVFMVTVTVVPSFVQIALFYEAMGQPSEKPFWWVPAGVSVILSVAISAATMFEIRK